MKRLYLSLLLVAFPVIESAAQWKPIGDKIKTEWADRLNPSDVLPEYPRPIMQRGDWKNLNGLWDYAIINKGERIPTAFGGKILVPFAAESSLSGVGKRVSEKQELIYQRSFDIPSAWKGKQVLLHFGAVDWKTDVWVNDVKVGSHTGGFTPFSFDITAALSAKGSNRLVVKVWDPTDKGTQPRGKQVSKPEGIWYTPVTGIWQTVWLEPVADNYIANLRITPDIDNHLLTVKAELNTNCPSSLIEVDVYDGNQQVATGKSINATAVEIAMPEDAKLWSPNSPFLYTLKVTLKNGNKIIDKVDSYAAMRKYSTGRDANGIMRLELNNKPLFQFGPLDQGWWPDGLYTAPTDEALLYDIQKTKDFGFNMIRKHIKVEPARWYTHCDRLGIIVWQDMPSGDRSPQWQSRKYFDGTELKRSAASEACYRKEWKEIMDCLYSYPCIGTWVPFNEAWGQFKTVEIAEWTKQHDPTRLVNPASGGNHYTCGDMLDLHHYPQPEMYLYDAQRPTVLGEYGGIGLVLKEHLWEPNRNWGYVQFNSSKEATDEYVKYADMLYKLIDRGFSAAVYTQTTDVEVEVNGLMTYDRKVIKLDEKRVREVNTRICDALSRSTVYRNPVIDYSMPDPSVIKGDDGWFYLYATENIRNLPIHRSKNLVDWEFIGTAFTKNTRPTFEPKGSLWAPDINKIGNKYVLYYSMSVWGGEWTCGIGCATADDLKGPFTDHGKMFRSNEINVKNSIDPFYIEEGGKKYLFWGSFRGIYAVELADDGLALKAGATPQQVAGTAYEGTYIYKKDGKYYLFASIGTCCEGLKSTYTTVVGRSDNLFGPYVDKSGGRMLDNKHEVLIHKNNSFVGTGHNSEIVTDNAGNDWIFYHAVSTKNPHGRVLMLDKVVWKDEWPSVEGSSPSIESPKPVF